MCDKERWKRLTNWDIINWLLRPGAHDADNDGTKPYWPVARHHPDHKPLKEIGWREVFFDPKRVAILKAPNRRYPEGATDEQLEAEYKTWIKSLIR